MFLPIILAMNSATSPVKLSVDLSAASIPVSKSLYGIFFEEINQGGEGGIFAELIQNRGFETGTNGGVPKAWHKVSGSAQLDATQPFNTARPRSLKLEGAVENEGFWGVPIEAGATYRLTVWAKGTGQLSAGFGESVLPVGALSNQWKQYTITLRANTTNPKSTLRLQSSGGTAYVGFTSLLPTKTWGKASLRPDLAQKVDAIKPAFVRFPGGCYIEGQDLYRGWKWKTSIGPVEQRAGKDWSFWGYSISDGLGFHEYLQWCEDMGAAGLFVANCGMSHSNHTPMSEMGTVVETTMDALEYALGPVDSKWGAERAKNGHKAPFKLKYVEIGNENGGPIYNERYALIAKAIKAKYPDIQLVACVWGGTPTSYPLELIDEHYYSNPGFFWSNANKYDTYDRKGPKVYVGEYAVTEGCGKGNLAAALGEAAFMTGMERNSDIVHMSSYAPLFSNVSNTQWNPDAIVFDNHRSYGTPSYWVQQMFSRNRADRAFKATIEAEAPKFQVAGGVGLQTWKTHAEFKDITVEVDGKPVAITGNNFLAGTWKTEGGILSQNDEQQDRRVHFNGVDLKGATKVTFSLKAKQVSGAEGFIVMVGTGSGTPIQFNAGGWDNTKHGFQVMGGNAVNNGVPGKIERNRWYDLKVEVDGAHFKGFIDGKLIQEFDAPVAQSFASVVGIDDKRHEVVVKLVNGLESERDINLSFSGLKVGTAGTVETLTGPALESENSLDRPLLMAPKKSKVRLTGNRYAIPARTVAILRLPLR